MIVLIIHSRNSVCLYSITYQLIELEKETNFPKVWPIQLACALLNLKFFVSYLTQEFQQNIWVYFYKEESIIFESVKAFKSRVEKQNNHVIESLRPNYGGNTTYTIFQDFLKENGIHSPTKCGDRKKTQNNHGNNEKYA